MKRKMIALLLAVGLMTGCGSSEELNTVAVKIDRYEKQVYETIAVERMDIEPQFTVDLISENQQTKFYSAPFDGLKVKEVYVAKGDMVKAGQLLLSFESETLEKEIEALEKEVAEDLLTLEHMGNLLAIKSDDSSKLQYEQFSRELTTKQMRISELKQEARDYSIYAEGSGMVTNINGNQKGTVVPSTLTLLYVSYGDGVYVGSTAEDYEFHVGEVYHAEYGISGYDITLVKMEGSDVKTLTFRNEMTAGSYCPWETLQLTLNGHISFGALVIPKECVFYKGEQAYVYMVDTDGYRKVRAITCGASAEGYVEVLSGLEEGEQVVIQ